MKRILTIVSLLLIFGITKLFSQQITTYSQYMQNLFMLNPAAAGATGFTDINLSAHEQWLGIPQSPKVHSVSMQGRLLKRNYLLKDKLLSKKAAEKKFIPRRTGKVGIGGIIYDDRNGLVSRTGGSFAYAYHIFVRRTQISFGLSFSLYQFKLNRDKMLINDINDPVTSYEGIRSIYSPDANTGIFVRNHYMFAGLSATQLFQSALKLGNKAFSDYQLMRHYHFVAGYNIYLDQDYMLEPSVMIKTTETIKNIQPTFACRLVADGRYFAGIAMQGKKDAIIIGGIYYREFAFGYSFNYSFNALQSHSWGSHEISATMRLGSSERRFRWKDRY